MKDHGKEIAEKLLQSSQFKEVTEIQDLQAEVIRLYGGHPRLRRDKQSQRACREATDKLRRAKLRRLNCLGLPYFEHRCFRPSYFSSKAEALAGCGRTALGTITGIAPSLFPPVANGQYSDKYMVTQLRKVGFIALSITPKLVLQQTTISKSDLVNLNHVVLVSQRLSLAESSWSVWYGGQAIHNLVPISTDKLELINFRLRTAYIVEPLLDTWGAFSYQRMLLQNDRALF